MTGLEYEALVAKYLRKHGYHSVSVTKASGDYGVDVIAHKGRHRYAVQCKYYSDDVGLEAVQEAVAGMAIYNCDKSMVVTNADFTKAAYDLAKANNVLLLSGIESSGVSTKIRTASIIAIPMLFFLVVIAAIFSLIWETIFTQLQNHEYKIAVYNIVSILVILSVVVAVIILIIKLKRRKK